LFLLDDRAHHRRGPEHPQLRHRVERPLRARDRPLVTLSLAMNYAIGGRNPFSYHLFNLAVHLLAALALFASSRARCAPAVRGADARRSARVRIRRGAAVGAPSALEPRASPT
jgi:hypothetical protein